ncbi:MAG: serine/threonine protein kinase [Clostridia bacterium]|nr:serine/threonine protein kinase [Clostridia bacterium]
MKRSEYIERILNVYSFVGLLSQKNGCEILHLRNKKTEADLVLRSFPHSVAAYEKLQNIRHINLPEIYDVLEMDDGQIVLEEYIDGLTVAQIMEIDKYRSSGARKVLFGLCDALTVLHDRGIVHRDVKPENVIVEKSGRVVLIDFNTSRVEFGASKDTIIMGTVGYASPEQLGLAQTDARTDIYAIGVLYNVMLTGQHPSVTIAPGKAGRIVRKCTAVNPNERYQTATELWTAL